MKKNLKAMMLTMATALCAAGASAADTASSGYVVEMDFSIDKAAAGICFAGQSAHTYYMWQINLEEAGNPKFRPHRWVNTAPALLDEFSIADKVSITADSEHHLKIEVENYNHAKTYIDDVLIDERDGDFAYGMIGFRETHSDGLQCEEAAYFDNVKLTSYDDGKVKFDENFSNGSLFTDGRVEDGRLYVAGGMTWDCYAWASPDNGVHFAMEADMTLVKDDVAFVFAEQNPGTYYMWAVNCFDDVNNIYPRIRRHMFINNNVNWSDHVFDQFTKEDILGKEHHVKIEVRGAYIYTYIDGVEVDRYMDWSDNLRPGLVGFRIDTQAEQDDDAYIDNVMVTVYDAEGNANVTLFDDFDTTQSWFPDAIVEEVDGNNKMHIYGDNVLYKWMQITNPSDMGYTIDLDFEIASLNAGICFAASNDFQTYYMWQINNENPSNPMLRPHRWENGNPMLIAEVPMAGKVDLTEGIHTLRLVIANNSSCSTYIDGVLVDSRKGNFSEGRIGFRETHSDGAGTYEAAYFDNIVVTSNNEEATVLYSSDFSNGNPYSDGEIIDGRLYVQGEMTSDHFAWSCDYNDVWYTLEADMTLMKDDVAFIFSHIDDNNYYMWAVNAFDRDEMLIRRHVFTNGDVWFNDQVFNNFTKGDILGMEHHVKIEVRGALVRTYIDGQLVDSYINFSDKLVQDKVGVRIDTRAEQDDDAYIDNIKVTAYNPDGTSNVVLSDNFEPNTMRWFSDIIIEEVDGDHKMHIYGDNVLYKWMQLDEPFFDAIHEYGDYTPTYFRFYEGNTDVEAMFRPEVPNGAPNLGNAKFISTNTDQGQNYFTAEGLANGNVLIGGWLNINDTQQGGAKQKFADAAQTYDFGGEIGTALVLNGYGSEINDAIITEFNPEENPDLKVCDVNFSSGNFILFWLADYPSMKDKLQTGDRVHVRMELNAFENTMSDKVLFSQIYYQYEDNTPYGNDNTITYSMFADENGKWNPYRWMVYELEVPYVNIAGFLRTFGNGAFANSSLLIRSIEFSGVPDNQDFELNKAKISWVEYEKHDNIDSISSENSQADSRYYNLQGVEISNPAAGQIYIRVNGDAATKVYVK